MEALCGAIKEGLDERTLEKEKEAPEAAEQQPAGKKLRARKGAKAAEETAEAPVAEAPAAEETPAE